MLQSEWREQVEIFSPSKFASATNCCSIADHKTGGSGFHFWVGWKNAFLKLLIRNQLKSKSTWSLQIQLGEVGGSQSTTNKALAPLSVEGKQSYAVAGREQQCPAQAGEPAWGKTESVAFQINFKILLRLPTRQCKFWGNILASFRVSISTCDCLALIFTLRQESRKNNEEPFPSLARKFCFKRLPSFSNCT